jgi:hypothetical protein
MALDSAEIVQERRDLFSFRLEEEESAMVGGMWRYSDGRERRNGWTGWNGWGAKT